MQKQRWPDICLWCPSSERINPKTAKRRRTCWTGKGNWGLLVCWIWIAGGWAIWRGSAL